MTKNLKDEDIKLKKEIVRIFKGSKKPFLGADYIGKKLGVSVIKVAGICDEFEKRGLIEEVKSSEKR